MDEADTALQEKLKDEHPEHPGRFQKLSRAICPKCGQQADDNLEKSGEDDE